MPSSVIRSYLYDPTKSELWITFVSGRRYIYAGVPQPVFDAFKAAPSRGIFSTWKFAAIMPIESFRVAEVAQAVTESGGTEADEIVCASRAIIRSMTL
jgi:KTSC domain